MTIEYIDRMPTMHEYAEGKRIDPKLTDYISRDDAIEAVAKLNRYDVDERNRLREYTPFHGLEVRTFIEAIDLYDALCALPSAEVPSDLISKAEVLETYADLYHEFDDNPNICKELHKVYDRINALPSADAVPQLRQTDTLIIADALRYLAKDTERHLVDRTRADALRQQFLKYGASMCKGGAE